MATKTLEKLIAMSPIAARLRRTASRDYKKANSVGFNAPDTSTPTKGLVNHPDMTCIPESQDEASSSLSFTDSQDCLENQYVSNSSVILTNSHMKSPPTSPGCDTNQSNSFELDSSTSQSSILRSPLSDASPVAHEGSSSSLLFSASETVLTESETEYSTTTSDSTLRNLPEIDHPEISELVSDETLQKIDVKNTEVIEKAANCFRGTVTLATSNSRHDKQPDVGTAADTHITKLFKCMETQLVSVLENAVKNEEIAKLSMYISELKAQLMGKDNTIRELKKELSAYQSLMNESTDLKAKLADAVNTKRGAEVQLRIVEAKLSETYNQIASLEDMNRTLIHAITPPAVPESVSAPASTVVPDDSTAPPVVYVSRADLSISSISPDPTLASNRQPHPTQPHAISRHVTQPLPTPPQTGATLYRQPGDSHSSEHDPEDADGIADDEPDPLPPNAPAYGRDSYDRSAAKSLSQGSVEVLFVGNSQFRHLDARKLRCGQSCHIHVLGNKTIEGALNFFEAFTPRRAPKMIALQVLSNSLEECLEPNAVMSNLVDLISIINSNCPGAHVAVGVPLPRLCTTPDLTRRYDIARDQVEERIRRLAEKRSNVSAVWASEIGAFTKTLFSDAKHLSHSPLTGSNGRTGLGLLARAFKAVIIPHLRPVHHEERFVRSRQSRQYTRRDRDWQPPQSDRDYMPYKRSSYSTYSPPPPPPPRMHYNDQDTRDTPSSFPPLQHRSNFSTHSNSQPLPLHQSSHYTQDYERGYPQHYVYDYGHGHGMS